jgi:hypothetical protein
MKYGQYGIFTYETDLIENAVDYWHFGLGITRGHYQWNGERVYFWFRVLRYELKIGIILKESD